MHQLEHLLDAAGSVPGDRQLQRGEAVLAPNDGSPALDQGNLTPHGEALVHVSVLVDVAVQKTRGYFGRRIVH